jgi:hypothetical protein
VAVGIVEIAGVVQGVVVAEGIAVAEQIAAVVVRIVEEQTGVGLADRTAGAVVVEQQTVVEVVPVQIAEVADRQRKR